jgi:hypothetical protein
MPHRLFAKIALGLVFFIYVAVGAWGRRKGKSIQQSLPPLAGPAMVLLIQVPFVFDLSFPAAAPFYVAAVVAFVFALRSLRSPPPKDDSGRTG